MSEQDQSLTDAEKVGLSNHLPPSLIFQCRFASNGSPVSLPRPFNLLPTLSSPNLPSSRCPHLHRGHLLPPRLAFFHPSASLPLVKQTPMAKHSTQSLLLLPSHLRLWERGVPHLSGTPDPKMTLQLQNLLQMRQFWSRQRSRINSGSLALW